MKIPTEGQFRVNNGPEFKENIAYTKNCNFDEEGVIKSSPALYNVINDTDNAGFTQVVDAVNTGSGNFTFFCDDSDAQEFEIDNLTVTADTDTPPTGSELRVTSFGSNSWLIGTAFDIYRYEADGTWQQRNQDSVGFLEQFPSRGTWVGLEGSNINQYATSELDDSPLSTTSTGPDLVLPSGYRVTGIAYSNYRVGIATENASGGDALFLTWDGASASANTGNFVKATVILDVVAYKESWVILTSKGQLLMFNGSGFDELANFQPYYFDALWIETFSSRQYGRMMQTKGDRIFINIGSQLTSDKYDSGILKGFYSGVWCYDPKVGLYHRHSLSHSKLKEEVCSSVSSVFTSTSSHYLLTGDPVFNSDNSVYYAIKINATTFKLASSYEDAIAGTNLTFNDGDRTLQWVMRTDWGQLNIFNNLVGIFRIFDDPLGIVSGKMPIFANSLLQSKTLTSDTTLCLAHALMPNISAIVTNKEKSEGITSKNNAITIKHRELADGDSVIIKYKTKEIQGQDVIGEADDATPDTGIITWTNATTFTFTNSMMDGSNLEVGDEVEFQSGAGAGQTAHIVSANLVSTTWTIVVDEDVRGGENGNKSTCRFDRWKTLATITNENSDGVFTTQVGGEASKWIQFKIEMRGVEIGIEDIITNPKTHNPVI